jgi:hypothetical protein
MNDASGVKIPEIPSEERKQLSEEMKQINEEFGQVKANFKKELPELQALKTEFDEFLKDVDLNDTGWFKGFRNRVLYAVPSDGSFTWGVYGADVFKILFFILNLYLDKVLFDRLSDYYHKSVISNFNGKKECLRSLYAEKVSFRDSKRFLQDSKALSSFVDECVLALDLDGAVNYKLLSYIFFNLSEKEVAKFLEHQIFPATKTGLLGLIKKAEKGKQQKVVSIYDIIEPMLMLYTFGGRPLFENYLHTIRSFSLNLAGWDYKVLDSYGFDLSKRMLIQVIFLKRLNVWYRNLFKKYLKANMKEFLSILDLASDINTSVEKVDDVLKTFLEKGMDCSFKQWFDYKNNCCANFGLLFEGIIMFPAVCKGGMFIYNNFVKKG